MEFIELFKARAKKIREKLSTEFVYLMSNLGINYNYRIKELFQCLKMLELKLIDAEKYWYINKTKLKTDLILLLEATSSLVRYSGWKHSSEVEKGFNLTLNAFYVSRNYEIEHDKKFKDIAENYRILKTLIEYYKQYCKFVAIVLNLNVEIDYIINYTETYFKEVVELIKKKESTYKKYVGINLKNWRIAKLE
ncbi:MAG: hypothetical protein ACRC2Q_05475 [Cetobacterium sp.]